jgi:hypothetical protein
MRRTGLLTMAGIGLGSLGLVFPSQAEPEAVTVAQLQQAAPSSRVISGKAQLPQPSALTVVSVNVAHPDPTTCRFVWAATLRNNGSTQAGSGVAVQAYQSGSGASRAPASGTSISSIPPGGTATTNPISFLRKANMSRLEIKLFEAGRVISAKVVHLPADPPTSISFGRSRITATGYTINVRNLNAKGVSDIVIQTHSSRSPTGPWSPAGGRLVECIGGKGNFRKTGSKPQDHSHVRVTVSRGGAVVASRIFSQSDNKRPGIFKNAPAVIEGLKFKRR